MQDQGSSVGASMRSRIACASRSSVNEVRARPALEVRGTQYQSASYRKTLATIERFAKHERATILLEGEAGTGKTTLARHIHSCSPRAERVFHRVDLGTLDDPLSSSDLFGHAAGSFTGAAVRRQGHFVSADRGTIFLDEIGKASLAVQRRLLHLIEYGEFTVVGSDRPVRTDVRIVAATNVPLESLVATSSFLPDLVPRFGYFRVRIPPLRERKSDIPRIVSDAIAARARYFGYVDSGPPEVSPELLGALCDADWPGNVRELLSAIDYLMVVADGARELDLLHCDGALELLGQRQSDADRAREAVRATGSVSGAARKLGVARTTVYRHLNTETGLEHSRS